MSRRTKTQGRTLVVNLKQLGRLVRDLHLWQVASDSDWAARAYANKLYEVEVRPRFVVNEKGDRVEPYEFVDNEFWIRIPGEFIDYWAEQRLDQDFKDFYTGANDE